MAQLARRRRGRSGRPAEPAALVSVPRLGGIRGPAADKKTRSSPHHSAPRRASWSMSTSRRLARFRWWWLGSTVVSSARTAGGARAETSCTRRSMTTTDSPTARSAPTSEPTPVSRSGTAPRRCSPIRHRSHRGHDRQRLGLPLRTVFGSARQYRRLTLVDPAPLNAGQRQGRAIQPDVPRRVGLRAALAATPPEPQHWTTWLHLYNHHHRHHTAIGVPPTSRVNDLPGHFI